MKVQSYSSCASELVQDPEKDTRFLVSPHHFELDAEGARVGGGQEFISFLMVDDVPVPMRALLGSGEGRGIALRELPGAAGRAGDSVSVTATADGLVACTLDDAPNLRIYLHAPSWTPSLADAFLSSLQKKD